jgi:hypothetical protein
MNMDTIKQELSHKFKRMSNSEFEKFIDDLRHRYYRAHMKKGELLEICYTEPIDVANYVNNDDYVCALCKCPIPMNFGIVIDKSKYKKDEYGFYHFHCNKCGLNGCVK